jgi:hypothetical protein
LRVRGVVLAPYIPVGSVSGSPVAGVLGNKLVTLGVGGGIRYCLRFFTLSTYSFGVEQNYIMPYLSSLRSVPYKHLSGRQQYDVGSLTWVAEECDYIEVVQSVFRGPLGEVSRPWCYSYGVGRLSGIACPSNS